MSQAGTPKRALPWMCPGQGDWRRTRQLHRGPGSQCDGQTHRRATAPRKAAPPAAPHGAAKPHEVETQDRITKTRHFSTTDTDTENKIPTFSQEISLLGILFSWRFLQNPLSTDPLLVPVNRASQKVVLVLFQSKRLYSTKREAAGAQMASCELVFHRADAGGHGGKQDSRTCVRTEGPTALTSNWASSLSEGGDRKGASLAQTHTWGDSASRGPLPRPRTVLAATLGRGLLPAQGGPRDPNSPAPEATVPSQEILTRKCDLISVLLWGQDKLQSPNPGAVWPQPTEMPGQQGVGNRAATWSSLAADARRRRTG